MTAVTTAGLLAGLFGSAFVPAAYAVTIGASTIASNVNFDGFLDYDFNDAENPTAAGDGNGTEAYPFYLVSPLSNNGAQGATSMASAAIADGTTDGSRLEFELTLAQLVGSNGAALVNPSATFNVTGDIVFYCTDAATVTASGNYNAFKLPSQTYTDSDVDTGVACQINAADDDSSGVGTMTLKVEDQVVKTWYVDLLGPGTQIEFSTATKGGYVAIGNSAVTNSLRLRVRDAAGSLLALYIEDQGIKLEDYINSDTDAELFVSVEGDEDSTLIVESASAGYLGLTASIDAALCDTTKNPGDTITAYAYADEDIGSDYDSTELKSATITLTCTGDGSLAQVVGYTAASTNVAAGTYTKITLEVEDGYGNPMGMGGDAFVANLTNGTERAGTPQAGLFSPAELVGDAAAANDGDYSSLGAGLFEDDDFNHLCDSTDTSLVDDATDLSSLTWNGEAVLCYLASTLTAGTHRVSIEMSAPDNADLGDPYTIAASFNVSFGTVVAAPAGTATIAAGPKLKTATITIPAAAGKLVTVTIEKVSTGKTFTYYRKANASGVAKFTIRRSGTWDVFASYVDSVTDTVTLKK